MKTEEKSKSRFADAVLFGVAAIWGGGFVAGKMALGGLSPSAVIAARFCGSALIFGILFCKRIRLSGKKAAAAGGIIGCVQFAALFVQLIALQYTTPMKQSFLAATYVVFTPFVAWLFTKKAPRARDLLVAVLALAGVGLISLTSSFTVQFGDALTLVFAVLFSLQIVLIERFGGGLDSIALTFYQFLSAGALSLIVLVFSHTSVVPSTSESLYGLLYIVLINTALAICLQNYAQKLTTPSRAALILSLESVFGFIFSAVIYKSEISIRMLAGCALVLAAVFASKLEVKKKA